MNANTIRKVAAAIAAAAGFMTTAQCSYGAMTARICDSEVTVTVEANTVDEKSSLYIVWDDEDKGAEMSAWGNTNKVEGVIVTSEGGTFKTTIPGIAGKKVRAFAQVTVCRWDQIHIGSGIKRYFDTGVKENEASGVEWQLCLVRTSSNWYPIMGGTHDKFTIGKNNSSYSSFFVRCHDGNELPSKVGFTDGSHSVFSLRRDGADAKTGVFRVNGEEKTRKTYGEDFVLYKGGSKTVHIGTTAGRQYFVSADWHYVKIWDANNALCRDYVAASTEEDATPFLFDKLTNTRLYSGGTGDITVQGAKMETLQHLTKAVSPVAAEMTVSMQGNDIFVTVGKDMVDEKSSLYIVWDDEDKGTDMSAWGNTNKVEGATVTSEGGTFQTTIPGITGKKIRAFAQVTVCRWDQVRIGNGRYFDTGVKENEASGVEMKLYLVYPSGNWCPVMGGTHNGFTIGKNNTSYSSFYVRCHDGDELPARPGFTDGSHSVFSLRRDDADAKTGVFCVNGEKKTSKTYGEDFVLYKNGSESIHIGCTVLRQYFASADWHYVKIWDADNALCRDYVAAGTEEGGEPCLFDKLTNTRLRSGGTGTIAVQGNKMETLQRETKAASSVATAVDPKILATATWTGSGSAVDPANWDCRNRLGDRVTGRLPDADADVTIGGEAVNFQLAEGVVITGRTVSVSATLSADSAWLGRFQTQSGMDALQADSTIELNGHALTIAPDYLQVPNRLVVKNAAAGDPATVTFTTPADTEYYNKYLAFQGNLKLVKKGAGTYVPWKQAVSTGSNYAGGTYLDEGTTRLVDGTWYCVFGGDQKKVYVGANAVLDTAGTYHVGNTPIFLDGGTIRNGVAMGNQNENSFGSVTLTADSTFRAPAATVINSRADVADWAKAVFDLGGHTLTFELGEVYLDIGNVVMTNGSVKVTGNGKFRTDGQNYHGLHGSGADFDIEANWIELYSDFEARNFTCRAKNPGYCDNMLRVYGTFLPATQNFPRTALQDGATIDLTGQTGAWDSFGAAYYRAKNPDAECYVRFPADGTVTVDVTGRTTKDLKVLAASAEPYLIKWTAANRPTNTELTVTGLPERFLVENTEGGLKLHIRPGLLFIVK